MPPTYSQARHQLNLNKIAELQPAIRPLAENLLRLSADAGVPLAIVAGHRSPEEQQALKDSGRGVTKAGALMSYHNHGLALDVVPLEYIGKQDWNPTGPLWDKVGAIGKQVGFEWGGDWTGFVDKPHFQFSGGTPIRELKAYYEKFKTWMPIKIEPTTGGAIMMLIVVGVFMWLYRDQL